MDFLNIFLQLDTDSSGRVSLGMSCMVRIHLRDGTFHDVRLVEKDDLMVKSHINRTLATAPRKTKNQNAPLSKKPKKKPSPTP